MAARSTRIRRKRGPASRRSTTGATVLRLAGGALCLVILLVYVPPVRAAADHVRDVVVRATAASHLARSHHARVARAALRYGIDFELAAAIERAAVAEEIDPDLAFRLVRVESRFKERAVSPAGALGLTQLMPATAADLQPGITPEEIFDRDTNLRLGFRYLHWLLRIYDGDVDEALHAYNRGPGTVNRIRAAGGDPANGYADRVLGEGPLPYTGSGLLPTLPGRVAD